MTNRTYPTPPGIPAGSRVAGIEIMADGRPQLVEGHMLTSGKVMWDRAIYSVPFNPDTMVKAEKPEPAWRQASRERAESTRLKKWPGVTLSQFAYAKGYYDEPWRCGMGDNRCSCESPAQCGYDYIDRETGKLTT